MYIVELLYRTIKKLIIKKDNKKYNIVNQEKIEKCNHIYLPIDSNGEILACTNCGKIIKAKELKMSLNHKYFFNNKASS